MAMGKRTSADQPLTEHDIAARLDRAAMRVLRILMDARQIDGLMDAIKGSRYLTNTLNGLAAELQAWDVEPMALPADDITERDAGELHPQVWVGDLRPGDQIRFDREDPWVTVENVSPVGDSEVNIWVAGAKLPARYPRTGSVRTRPRTE